jgi:hypothetical protein
MVVRRRNDIAVRPRRRRFPAASFPDCGGPAGRHSANEYRYKRPHKRRRTHPEWFGMLHFNGIRDEALMWWEIPTGAGGIAWTTRNAGPTRRRSERSERHGTLPSTMCISHSSTLGALARSRVRGHDGGKSLLIRTKMSRGHAGLRLHLL